MKAEVRSCPKFEIEQIDHRKPAVSSIITNLESYVIETKRLALFLAQA